MSVYEERMRILRDVQEGRTSKTEATRQLQNLELRQEGANEAKRVREEVLNSPGVMNPRMVRIRKTDLSSGEQIYEILFQASLIEAARRLGSQFSAQLENLNHNELENLMLTHIPGILFDEVDEANQIRTEVFIF